MGPEMKYDQNKISLHHERVTVCIIYLFIYLFFIIFFMFSIIHIYNDIRQDKTNSMKIDIR